MDDGERPASRPASPTAEPRQAPSDTELSRIAREAVHQPPDPRLDRHLQRMGLVDPPDTPAAGVMQPIGTPVASGPNVELLERRLRQVEIGIAILAIALVVLAIVEVIQLIG